MFHFHTPRKYQKISGFKGAEKRNIDWKSVNHGTEQFREDKVF